MFYHVINSDIETNKFHLIPLILKEKVFSLFIHKSFRFFKNCDSLNH